MLELINVYKTFNIGTVDERLSLNNINLKVNDGDFITIIGSNGAGKSTLFNCISGNKDIDSGKIILDGIDISKQKEHIRSKKIGRLFQETSIGTCPDLSIEENMGLCYLQSQNRSLISHLNKNDKEIIKQQLATLGIDLENRMSSKISTLSGGQRQALTLLMATMAKPKLLLLDEHTAALDPAMAEKIIALTKKIVKENNITTLMITHNMKQALELGNRTLMMKDGKIVYDLDYKEKQNCSVNDLLNKFKENTNAELDDDKIVLSI